jgi:peptidyl-prolyl cis-trans isomerase SurA
MTESPSVLIRRVLALALVLGLLAPASAAWAQKRPAAPRVGDYVAAVVNQELVTAGEIDQRVARVRENAARGGNAASLPPDAELRQQVLDSLIEERVLVSQARDSGVRVDEVELDRAVASVATQNQLTMPQLRERLRQEGLDYGRFRANLRDQIMVDRFREREVQARIRISDADIDQLIDKQRASAAAEAEYNLAQILVTVPENASDAVIAERRARAERALSRVRGGEDFAAVAKEISEDGNRERGGEIGLRSTSRLPELFVEAARPLKVGEVAPRLLRSGAGFHVLKLVERREGNAFRVTQTHARHILLRPASSTDTEATVKRLADYKRSIERGSKKFEQLAREFSEDGSAAQGGDLGWVSPGAFVPEFEEAMNRLPIGGVSDPVTSRFGVHLIQVLERRETTLDVKQVRDQARNTLREQKYEQAYAEWVRDLRSRSYIELREPPL